MPVMLPETVYDTDVNFHWMNAHDRVSYQREFEQGDIQAKKRAQALITANPLTTNLEIQVNMCQPPVPDRFGYDRTPKTISDVLDGDFYPDGSHINDSATTDFSGSNGAFSGTDLPSIPVW